MKTGYITLATILLSSCSTTGMFNTYIDFSDIDHNKQAVCTDISLPTTADARLKKSFNYACGVRNTYRDAMGNRSRLRRGAVLPVLGLGATGVGLGLSGYDTTTILATALTGATIAGGTNIYDNRSNEIAYALGSEAITCAMKAVLPLVTPADAREMREFDAYLSASNSRGIEVNLANLRKAILSAESFSRNEEDVAKEDLTTISNQISAARELITLTEATIKNARAMRTHQVQVPGALTSAVYSITDQVDTSIQKNSLSIDATVAVIRGLTSSYQSFTAVPTEPAQSPVPPTTGGNTPAVPIPTPAAPEELKTGFQDTLANIRSEMSVNEIQIRKLDGDIENTQSDIQSYQANLTETSRLLREHESSLADNKERAKRTQGGDISEAFKIMTEQRNDGDQNGENQVDLDSEDLEDMINSFIDANVAVKAGEEKQQSLQSNIDVITKDLEAKKQAKSMSEERKGRLESRLRDLEQKESTMLNELSSLNRKYQNSLEAYEKMLASAANSQNQIDFQSSQLANAINKVNTQRRLLADVVNSAVALKPMESLEACGVDPESVVGALSVSPARLEFTKEKIGSQYVVINGGQAPFSVSLTRGDDAVELEKTDPFSSSFSVYFNGTSEQRRDILIVDGRNARIIVPVNVMIPVSDQGENDTAEREPKRGLDPAKLSDRVSASAASLAASNIPVKELQQSICVVGIDADGKWGPNSQSRYEVNRGIYGLPLDDDGIVTVEVVTLINAKLSDLKLSRKDLVCTNGNLTFPSKS